MSIAKTGFSVRVFASLLFGRVVATSYSKFESNDGGGERNIEGAGGNPPLSSLISLYCLNFFVFYSLLLVELFS